jgi:hypothetical protein
MLPQPMNKLMGISKQLGYQIVLVEIFKVIVLLEHLIVRSCSTFDISNETFILEIHLPIFLIIVLFGGISWLLIVKGLRQFVR